MTADELKAARAALGVAQNGLAELLRVSCRTVQEWEQGRRPVPGPAEVAVELLLEKHRKGAGDAGGP